MAYRFDDPALEKPPLVRWTPEDMWEARPFVAATSTMPPELVTDFHVWVYRLGGDPATIEFEPEMIAAVNEYMGNVEMGTSWGDETESAVGAVVEGHKSMEEWGTPAEELT